MNEQNLRVRPSVDEETLFIKFIQIIQKPYSPFEFILNKTLYTTELPLKSNLVPTSKKTLHTLP
jgi:hypothetical protein